MTSLHCLLSYIAGGGRRVRREVQAAGHEPGLPEAGAAGPHAVRHQHLAGGQPVPWPLASGQTVPWPLAGGQPGPWPVAVPSGLSRAGHTTNLTASPKSPLDIVSVR